MQPEAAPASHTGDGPTTGPLEAGASEESPVVAQAADSKAALTQSNAPQFPPPKTDKPRPHVCGTCGRSFARLEHLKRHERSHTKEKPFECQECSRCFARRDLLLRHQQKLHYQNNPSSRPKNGRRESTSSTAAGGRVRKNSIANANVGGTGGIGTQAGRPRANTLGHMDLSSLGLVDNLPGAHSRVADQYGMAQHRMSMSETQRPSNLSMSGVSMMNPHHNTFGLSKLETNVGGMDFVEQPLRTAPAITSFGGFDLDQLFTPGGNTINPAQLHFGGNAATSQPPNLYNYPSLMNGLDGLEGDDDFSWMRNFQSEMQGMAGTEHAIEESSPSRFSSTASQSGFSEHVADAPNGASQSGWNTNDFAAQALLTPGALNMDGLSSGLPSIDPPAGTISPQNLHDQITLDEPFLDSVMHHANLGDSFNGIQFNNFAAPSLSNFGSDSPSVSSASARHSSVTSISTDSITEATRQALLLTLSQASMYGHTQRKYSQPAVSSPLSVHNTQAQQQHKQQQQPQQQQQQQQHQPVLPSTADLQRYVSAYVNCMHPHLPFLHVPSLSFDSPDYVNNMRSSPSHTSANHGGIVGGGGCLVLAMSAIGALYEYDHQASRELFEASKKLMQLYLEERRKAGISSTMNSNQYFSHDGSISNTPVWLVQAMLLNVVYGHFSGDKKAADIASTHCAALVSLARAAELFEPVSTPEDGADLNLEDNFSPFSQQHLNLHNQWMRWKDVEERKRTLFAVFILSSLLVTAYNQTPAIMNSEVMLDLPCDEELWRADTAQDWLARGGSRAAEANSMPFAAALTRLLSAGQKQQTAYNFGYGNERPLEPQLRPSTFGCLVLINALHNYIWETRSRHHGRQWTVQETESMFSHIEPALNAWQTAWKSNEHHKLVRPNPFGRGPLSADSIPLLDLAFVRLFVNLGRSKEAFWQRDFDAMAEELARGVEVVQHADGSPGASGERASSTSAHSPNSSASPSGSQNRRRQSHISSSGQSSKRERHLRKAAFYAADSLGMASKCSLTFADVSAHELPIQSAMCFFDCSQVLAEWACTVQERVGRYLGIIGQADIDYTQVPAIMLLEIEDVELLGKIENICSMLEDKMLQQAQTLARELSTLDPSVINSLNPMDRLAGLNRTGLGARILRVTGFMLEKAAVWPVTHVMANALEMQAAHMNQRAEVSMTAPST